MKTYPLFKTIINLCWLGLFVLIVFVSLALADKFSVEREEIVYACGVVDEQVGGSNDAIRELVNKGKILFKVNCASCHAKDMKTKMTGPALGGVVERWEEYPKEDLFKWIRNSGKLIDEGHPRAVALKAEWKSEMTAFTNLSDEDIAAILAYINI